MAVWSKQRRGLQQGGLITGGVYNVFTYFALKSTPRCIRLLASIARDLDLDLCHFDAEHSFIQSELQGGVLCVYYNAVVTCLVKQLS